jgi:enamine deaminase RidA (YjgF/YER057c/UK114 family)
METGILRLNGTEIKYAFLKDSDNNWLQLLYAIIPERPEQIKDQIETIEKAESKFHEMFKIKGETAAWKRFFSSDLITHHTEIMNYKKRQGADFSISLTEQPPASNVKAAMLGMCLSNITAKFRDDKIFYFDTESGIRHIFAEHLIDSDADEHSDSEEQTKKIFGFLQKNLLAFNTSIEDSVLRTWIYAPHVDADYPGIVKARNQLFDSINLTKETHYIASTGIQGGSGNRFARVFMDAYAVTGVTKDKIRYIQAPEYLSPTALYGVAFERATAAALGKIDFLFISGTASIDKKGEVVHPGNISKQAERTLQNISALLESAGFAKEDLSSFIVYLRDPADYSFIRPQISRYSKKLPVIYVKAPVCRPGWLIEIEATAAKLLS